MLQAQVGRRYGVTALRGQVLPFANLQFSCSQMSQLKRKIKGCARAKT